jgi:hypothetical protein
MDTEDYFVKMNLNPGFCPYYPTLRIKDIIDTQLLIDKTVNKNGSLSSLAWQNSVNIFIKYLNNKKKII